MDNLQMSQMSRAAQVVNALGMESYWSCPAKRAVFGLFLYSPYANPNNSYPYTLSVRVYAPGPNHLADSVQYLGGVSVDGVIVTTEMNESYYGTLVNNNVIRWNDGSVWSRVTPPTDNTINQYSAQAAYAQAANNSAYFNTIYNRAYPNLYRYWPY